MATPYRTERGDQALAVYAVRTPWPLVLGALQKGLGALALTAAMLWFAVRVRFVFVFFLFPFRRLVGPLVGAARLCVRGGRGELRIYRDRVLLPGTWRQARALLALDRLARVEIEVGEGGSRELVLRTREGDQRRLPGELFRSPADLSALRDDLEAARRGTLDEGGGIRVRVLDD